VYSNKIHGFTRLR